MLLQTAILLQGTPGLPPVEEKAAVLQDVIAIMSGKQEALPGQSAAAQTSAGPLNTPTAQKLPSAQVEWLQFFAAIAASL